MTENEAKVFIENAKEQSKSMLAELLMLAPKVFAVKKKDLGEYYSNLENCKKEIEACEVAVKALEEIQQYRAIGTVEECRKAIEKQKVKKTLDRCMFCECPTCGNVEILHCAYCPDCGQKLDWNNEKVTDMEARR